MRWLVGDIQGCAIEFDRLLREIRYDPAHDELWSLGDLVNRGPDSLEVLRLWRDAGGHGIIGNHDIYALRAYSDRGRRKPDQLDALFRAPDAEELLGLLRELPVLVHLPGQPPARDVWIVHAGLHPHWNDLPAAAAGINAAPHDDVWMTRPEVSFATRVRWCTAEGELVRHAGGHESAPPGALAWDDLYRGETLVVHGHWARRGHYRSRRTMGLDSGCVYGGELTAWSQQEDRIVQVRSTRR